MERFELTVVAQGPQSIWVAVIVIALVCATVSIVAISRVITKSNARIATPSQKRSQIMTFPGLDRPQPWLR
jgi:hypothetical protein